MYIYILITFTRTLIKCSFFYLKNNLEVNIILTQESISIINNLGYCIIDINDIDGLNNKDVNDKISLIDKDGYKYYCSTKHIIAGHKPHLVYKDNLYSVYNIKMYLKLNSDLYSDFELLSDTYINASQPLKFQCNKCGTIFFKKWNQIKTGCRCNNCLSKNRGYLIMTSEKYKTRLIDYPEIVKDFDKENNEYPIESYTHKSGQNINWKCHKCGYRWHTSPAHRIKDHSRCPNCAKSMSKAEQYIYDYLKNNDIDFIQEKTFDDCRDKNPLPFDFYLPDKNQIIEFDGEQHGKPVKFSCKMTDEDATKQLYKTKMHDEIKNNYCKANNINLVRINNYGEIQSTLDNLILK